MDDAPRAILVVHERYREAGGEDAVVAAEVELLAAHGHRVETLILDNAAIPRRPSPAQRLRLATGTVWSGRSAARMRSLVRRLRPDLVHVHNTLPLLSPAVLAVAHAEGVPTVQTLHNYRLVCPAATLYRAGAPCEDCLRRRVAWPGVWHRCYRGSRAETAAVAAMLAVHRARGTWRGDVDRFIALTDFARGRLVAGGLPPERIEVKPNFVAHAPEAGDARGPREDDAGHLFLGRLVAEKGIPDLLRAVAAGGTRVTCRIAGGGPLEAEVRAAASIHGGLTYLGALDRAGVARELRRTRALVMPSTWYEGFPMALVEAYAAGVPVIASRLGSLEELVEDGRTGLHVAPGDATDLARALAWSHDHPEDMQRMGEAARHRYEERYTPEANYAQLMAIYAHAREEHGGAMRRAARPISAGEGAGG